MTTRFLIPLCALFAMLMSAPVQADDHDHGEHAHYDIAPYLVDGNLLTGGLDHDGHHTAPTIHAYGYEFGEQELVNPALKYNAADPGVNQAAGVGGLPAGAALQYDIISTLMYWDGTGEPHFGLPGDGSYITTGPAGLETVTGTTMPAGGPFGIQNVHSNGSVHYHFNTWVKNDGAGVDPADGIYAFQTELVLDDSSGSGSVYTSNPFWIVMNNHADEHAHHEAMEVLGVPEPGTIGLLLSGLLAVGITFRRRRA